MSGAAADRVAVVFGTRPEIIKLAPVIAELGDVSWPVFTGQHFDSELSDQIFASCGLATIAPALHGVGGRPRAEQVATMLDQLITMLSQRRPGAVVVQGDTNSANAGAQAGHYLGIPVVHVEAGLRSHDRAMPEEINRLLISVLADVHCAATPANALTLVESGYVDPQAVHVTGNPVVEALLRVLPDRAQRHRALAALGLRPGEPFVLATLHRPENSDDPVRLCTALDQLAALGRPVLLPLHPRTRHRMADAGITAPPVIQLLPPLDYRSFLALEVEAQVIVSDSGGLQEEVTVLRKPLVVVRTSTERQESVVAGFSMLCEPHEIVRSVEHMLSAASLARIATEPSPFGDGAASRRIADLARAVAAGVRQG